MWTHDVAFYLDGTAFAYKRNPLDQALAPKARVLAEAKRRTSVRMYRERTKNRHWGSNGKINGGYQF